VAKSGGDQKTGTKEVNPDNKGTRHRNGTRRNKLTLKATTINKGINAQGLELQVVVLVYEAS